MTAVGQVDDAVRAMKLGALDFLSKPVDHKALVALVGRSISFRATKRDAQVAQRLREHELHLDIVAHSPAFTRTLEIAGDVARSEVDTVLLLGESGTGKNVVARHIHATSPRSTQPLLQVNCAAIPDQLIESELFGHEKGAFTDAKSSKLGTFELADGGAVLLDEVAELKLDVQAKLLHLLEDRTFKRVGGNRQIQVDTRVIALTNRNIREMVARKEFRDDLYYRLSIFPIEVPPLRERHEDVLPLALFFLKSLEKRMARRFEGFSRAAENTLLAYSWPGNVRELRNVIERAVILESGSSISEKSLVLDVVQATSVSPEEPTPPPAAMPEGIVPLAEMEREMVRRAMRAAGNNQSRAAELLGVSRDQLRYRLKRFNL